MIFFFLYFAAVVWNFICICRRLLALSQRRRFAKRCIGDEVSVYTDKGARYAYKGIYAYLNNDYSRALEHFKKAMEHSVMSHNNSFCYDWMAQCYDAQEKTVESLDCCVKAVNVEPSNIKSLFSLADMYARNGMFSKAEFYYKRILRYDSDNTAAIFMLGTIYEGVGRYDDAEKQFVEVLEKDATHKPAISELLVVKAIKGEELPANVAVPEDDERLQSRIKAIKRMRKLCNDC